MISGVSFDPDAHFSHFSQFVSLGDLSFLFLDKVDGCLDLMIFSFLPLF